MTDFNNRSQKKASKHHRSQSACVLRASLDFQGYELLLLKKLQSDPVLCCEWREKLQQKLVDDDYDLGVG